ncbi:MAG: proline racemase family protein [Thermoplasmata archaeon]
MKPNAARVRVVDSHTGGEPTRVIVAGGPPLGTGSMVQRRQRLATDHDDFRTSVVGEPRTAEAAVGALLCDPEDIANATGAIFFDSAGYLGMCGHGTIGVISTLAYLRRIQPGAHTIETPVGVIQTRLHADGAVTFTNVASYRTRPSVSVVVPGFGAIVGDVAWGGNWFFLVENAPLPLVSDRIPELTTLTLAIREALRTAGIRGAAGESIEHVALYDERHLSSGTDSRNFVLCPGGAYDRSPCGTGTSARLACLFADGRIALDKPYWQESIVGSRFEGRVVEVQGDRVIPRITGSAHIVAESELVLDPRDPFGHGFLPVRGASRSIEHNSR